MSLGQKVASSAIWASAGSYLSFGIGLAGGLLLARLLDPTDFGVYALALAISEFLNVLGGFSFPMAVIQNTEWSDEFVSTTFLLSLGNSLLIICIACIIFVFSLAWLPYGTAVAFLVICLFRPVVYMGSVYGATLEREMAYSKISVIRVIASAISWIGALAGALLGIGYWSLVAQYCLFAVVTLIGSHAQSSWRFSKQFSKAMAVKIWGFGKKLFVMRICEVFVNQFDRLMLGSFVDSTSLGFYTQSRYVAELGAVAVAPASVQVAFSAFSRVQHDGNKLSRMYSVLSFYLVRSMFLLAVLLFLFPTEILWAILGPRWTVAAPILRLLSLHALAQPVFKSYEQLYIAIGSAACVVKMRLLQVFAYSVLLPLAVLEMKAEGAAIATSLVSLLTLYLYHRSMPSHIAYSPIDLYRNPLIAGGVSLIIGILSKVGLSAWHPRILFPYLMMALVAVTFGVVLFVLESVKLKETAALAVRSLRSPEFARRQKS
ncbi:MAG: oligosaccharide flippase family protein [Candidatus Methanomethyliaceae archaeon]